MKRKAGSAPQRLLEEQTAQKEDQEEIKKRKHDDKKEQKLSKEEQIQKKFDSRVDHLLEQGIQVLGSEQLGYATTHIPYALPNRNVLGNHPDLKRIVNILFPQSFWTELADQANQHMQKTNGMSNDKFKKKYYDEKV